MQYFRLHMLWDEHYSICIHQFQGEAEGEECLLPAIVVGHAFERGAKDGWLVRDIGKGLRGSEAV